MIVNSALVVGASGIVGNNLARHLRTRGWHVHGLARRPPTGIEGLLPIAADLLGSATLRLALRGVDPTDVFIATWLRQKTEAENIQINRAMVRNVLDALSPSGSVKHVALVTGLKHYLGPFETYGKGTLPATPFREEQPRLDLENFYYAQEDELFAAAERDGFGWSVHRPHTIVGYAVGNAMNMGVTLAIYATICRETGRPFLFPGSVVQWNGLTDLTDARLLARHLEWATTTEAVRNQAFNVVNGDVFRWSWMWARIADWFGLRPAPCLTGLMRVPVHPSQFARLGEPQRRNPVEFQWRRSHPGDDTRSCGVCSYNRNVTFETASGVIELFYAPILSGGCTMTEPADINRDIATTSRRRFLREGSALLGGAVIISGLAGSEALRVSESANNLPANVPEWMKTPGDPMGTQPYGTPSPFEKGVIKDISKTLPQHLSASGRTPCTIR